MIKKEIKSSSNRKKNCNDLGKYWMYIGWILADHGKTEINFIIIWTILLIDS